MGLEDLPQFQRGLIAIFGCWLGTLVIARGAVALFLNDDKEHTH